MRLVAIDVAEHEVRVAWGERGLGAARLTAVERVPRDRDPESLRTTLAAIASARPGAVLTTVPLAHATHRRLALPFRIVPASPTRHRSSCSVSYP